MTTCRNLFIVATALSCVSTFAQEFSDFGKGRVTTREIEQRDGEGHLTSTTLIEDRHIDVRQVVTETLAANSEGLLVPKRRVTERTDSYRGTIRIQEEPIAKNGEFVVVRVEVTVRDEQGGSFKEVRVRDEISGQMVLELRENVVPQEDGSSKVETMKRSKDGRLITTRQETIRTDY